MHKNFVFQSAKFILATSIKCSCVKVNVGSGYVWVETQYNLFLFILERIPYELVSVNNMHNQLLSTPAKYFDLEHFFALVTCLNLKQSTP